MVGVNKNSFDLLRLMAASLVLYSHQFALLGSADPSFFGWTTFGGAGVNIFFFLSGMLVWSSWDRDSDLRRFFTRRSLRIFPALWVLVLCTVFVLGPIVSTLHWSSYFSSRETWQYLTTGVLVNQHNLPGVFAENPFPSVVNGSLWTLPVEFLCYVSVASIGSLRFAPKGILIAATLFCAVLLSNFGPMLVGVRFASHFEMVAVFWWGVLYGYCTQPSWSASQDTKVTRTLLIIAFICFAFFGLRALERTVMLTCAVGLVQLARTVSVGARLTDAVGDLSYGLYIFAFPIQQLVVYLVRDWNWSWGGHFCLSLLITTLMAYASWHLVERKALRFKPSSAELASALM